MLINLLNKKFLLFLKLASNQLRCLLFTYLCFLTACNGISFKTSLSESELLSTSPENNQPNTEIPGQVPGSPNPNPSQENNQPKEVINETISLIEEDEGLKVSLTGTTGYDILKVDNLKTNVKYTINGKGGDDVLILNSPSDWFTSSVSIDNILTLNDKHATGALLEIKNVKYIQFPGQVVYRILNGTYELEASANIVSPPTSTSPDQNNIPIDTTIVSADLDSLPTEDEIIISEKSNKEIINHPVQLGRAFKRGQIANFPQVQINGSTVPTQADVKQRYSDGSVKFAILSFIIPKLLQNSSNKVNVINTHIMDNTGINKAQMLAAEFDFDATITAEFGSQSYSVSARKMIENGHYIHWTKGAIANTVVLADHSEIRKYDLGNDSYKSLRPIFHVTFWPGINKVKVRYILENSLYGSLQELKYNLSLSIGNGLKKTLLNEIDYIHSIGSRWTHVDWIGGEPEKRVSINHNLKYIISTQFLPNFYLKNVTEAEINKTYYNFQKRNKGFGSVGNDSWVRYMPTTGARSELAPVPGFYMYALLKGDWRSHEIMQFNADKALSWALNFRESSNTLLFNSAKTVPAIGRPLSLNARPGIWFPNNNGQYTSDSLAENQQSYRSPYDSLSWTPDGAHQPDPFFVPYILTGDYLYLEQMQMWSANWAVAYSPNSYNRIVYGKACFNDQIRGNAWVLRNRVHAYFSTPDDDIGKDYYRQLVTDAISCWEGYLNLKGSENENSETWIATLKNWHNSSKQSTLGFFGHSGTEALWQNYFWLISLGMAKEKGIGTDFLLSHSSKVLNSQFVDPKWNPKLLTYYYVPLLSNELNPFSSWGELQTNLSDKDSTIQNFHKEYSYACYASGAASFTKSYQNGDEAHAWIQDNIRPKNMSLEGEYLNFNILPR